MKKIIKIFLNQKTSKKLNIIFLTKKKKFFFLIKKAQQKKNCYLKPLKKKFEPKAYKSANINFEAKYKYFLFVIS